MPWKECSAMDEHPRFVAKLLDGDATTDNHLKSGSDQVIAS
jgi:hypothetical protein